MGKIHLFIISMLFSTLINGQITINGDFSDWASIPVLINDATGDGSNGWDFDNVYVTDDATNVYFRIQTTSSVAGTKTLYLLISVDPQNEPSTRTGLSYGWWDNGYDFMIQYSPANVTLYRHTGDSDGWDWENGGSNSQKWKQTDGSDDFSDIEISVSKNDLDQPNISGWSTGSQNKIAVMTFVDDGSFGEEAGSGSNHGGVTYTMQNGVLPVELITFTAQINNNNVTLLWKTATEINNHGFYVERLSNPLGNQPPGNNENWKILSFVEGYGNSNSLQEYSFKDTTVNKTGAYYYRLKQTDINGSYKYSKTIEVNFSKPATFKLCQNYPNPFNPTTLIEYSLPEADFVKINVYDILGNLVKKLTNEYKPAGNYSVSFDGSNLSSGVYYYIIQAGIFKNVKKMLLIK